MPFLIPGIGIAILLLHDGQFATPPHKVSSASISAEHIGQLNVISAI